MLILWVAYTFFYTTVLWFHLNSPNPTPTDDFIRTLTETPASTPTLTPPIFVPTSSRIPVPSTIIFPASPLPTARLLHKALPRCYDGLHDDLPLVAGTRTVTGTATELVVDSPSPFMRYFLVASALASTLAHYLARSTVGLALICVSGLLCASWVLFMVRRTVVKTVVHHPRTVCRCHPSLDKDPNTREVVCSTVDSFSGNVLSIPTHPSTSPFKKLAAMPASTKTERLIARRRRMVPANGNRTPETPRINPALLTSSPPLVPPPLISPPFISPPFISPPFISPPPPNIYIPSNFPPETAEVDTRVRSIGGSSAAEYIPPAQCYKKHASPVEVLLATLD